MRTLVSIQKIVSINSIENAENIEVATILGWQVVVKKNQFKVNDLVVYAEIDSVLPFAPWSEFLRDKHRPERPIRIKTIKLRGQISQGICFDLSILPTRDEYDFYADGQDVTEILGVTKYEIPEEGIGAQLGGRVRGNFPSFLQKTDETRIQAAPSILERHNGKTFYVTEKLDGSSMTMYLRDDKFGVCSRNLELTETEGNAFWTTARNDNWEDRIRRLSQSLRLPNICLQGELVGAGIQKNKYKLTTVEAYIFNIYNIDSGKFLDFPDFYKSCFDFNIKTVPMIETHFILQDMTVDKMLEYVKGFSALNSTSIREGLVFRPHIEEYEHRFGRLSFKVINNDFLLKHGE